VNIHHHTFQFSLSISPDEYAAYYEGTVKYVLVKTHCGRNLQFPASVLRRFIRHNGIHGLFEIEVDKDNKLVNIRKIK